MMIHRLFPSLAAIPSSFRGQYPIQKGRNAGMPEYGKATFHLTTETLSTGLSLMDAYCGEKPHYHRFVECDILHDTTQ